MAKNQHLRTGQDGEQQALNFLLANQLKFITKNYSCRYGEIDLIMMDGEILVFIEVRKRKKSALVSANESINPQKLEKIKKSAWDYLQKHNDETLPDCRFDAICINGEQLEWIKNIIW